MVYPLADSSQVNQSQLQQKLNFTKQQDGTFLAEKIRAYGPLGFAVGTIDQQDGANNSNGIYAIETRLNGEKTLEVLMDKFSFAETRYLNRMIDYALYEGERERVQKLFIERNNPLSIFKYEKDNGILNLTENGSNAIYSIKIRDIQDNTTTLVIPIEIKKEEILTPKIEKTTPYFVQADASQNFEVGDWELFIPDGAFYDDYYLDISAKTDALHLDEDLVII